MQVAYYYNEIVHLPSCDRSRWQKIYTASLHEKVTCIHCHTPLKMKLTFHSPPVFIHPHVQDECLHVVEIKENNIKSKIKEKEASTTNKIRLPQRRSITSHGEQHSTQWKEPTKITEIPPYTKITQRPNKVVSGYRATLQESDIYLDDNQWSAVTTTEGPLLILAGAGSGKTRVLTARAAYMLQTLSPKEMILITFTAKAAKEMKERMSIYPNMTQSILQQLVVGTFHSIFYKMLQHDDPNRWNSSRLLKFDWQRLAMLKEAGREINLEENEFAYDQALTQISWWKNHLLNPHEAKTKSKFEDQCLYLYRRYEQMREVNQTFDFDDMLLGTYQLLQGNHDLLKRYQQRFSYLSIDEFQDINKVQFEIVKMLADSSKNICVVGDDDQAIYSFRGSDPSYILSFKDQYKETTIVTLNENYRSSHEIVSVANNVITTNRKRHEKLIRAQLETDIPPLLIYPYDEEEEATMILTHIKERIKNGAQLDDFAILFRTNSSARAVIERFISSNIPFQLHADGESFYRRNAVRKMLAFFRLAIDENDTEGLPDLISALFLKQRAVQDVKALSISHDCSIIEAFSYLEGLQPFQMRKLQNLAKQFKELRTKTPLEAIDFVESTMGFNDYIKKRSNEGNIMERGSDDIRDLKVVARLHPTLDSLLEHASHMTAKYQEHRKEREKKDAVQLMTIHRAKGLEFKTVYLIGALEGSLPHDYALEALRENDRAPLEEERRLMYVALTRAIEQLYVSVPMRRRGSDSTSSRFVREMQHTQSIKV